MDADADYLKPGQADTYFLDFAVGPQRLFHLSLERMNGKLKRGKADDQQNNKAATEDQYPCLLYTSRCV